MFTSWFCELAITTHQSSCSVVMQICMRMEIVGFLFVIQEFPGKIVPEFHVMIAALPLPGVGFVIEVRMTSASLQFPHGAGSGHLGHHSRCRNGVRKCCLSEACSTQTIVIIITLLLVIHTHFSGEAVVKTCLS